MAKNFDTLYERTFAEALNLHLRCPKMVLGEFYMIAVNEYDSNAANNRQIAYRGIKGIKKQIEKYILSFDALNNRSVTNGEHYKYERVCLLIVDFKEQRPVVYSSDRQLKEAGLLSAESPASIENMNCDTFVDSLISTYRQRFGTDKLRA